jgi:phosphonate transport system permease protein
VNAHGPLPVAAESATATRPGMPPRPAPGGRAVVLLTLLGAFLPSALAIDRSRPLLHANGLHAVAEIAGGALRPDLSGAILGLAARAAWQTVAYATAGVSLAILLALPAGVLASGVLVRRPALAAASGGAVRALLGLLRAVHELVWAWLFVAAVGLSPAAAVLALALPYAGILGRILADMLRDVPAEPLVALRAAGANEAKVLLYGRLPAALPDMVSYALYRYECGLRSAAVLSFVGLGGLGFQIQLSLDDLRFAEVWTFVYALVLLVVVVELASAAVRSRLRS